MGLTRWAPSGSARNGSILATSSSVKISPLDHSIRGPTYVDTIRLQCCGSGVLAIYQVIEIDQSNSEHQRFI